MKPKIYFIRSLPILMMLGLTIISAVLSLVMFFISASTSGVHFPWMLFGDELLPLLFFITALLFRNRYCALAAIVISFINIFLRISAIVIFQNTFMPMEYSTLRLLLLHADFPALQAIMGRYFLLWLTPLIAIAAAAVIYCCHLVWKTAKKTSRQLSRRFLLIFSVFLGLSLLSNLIFQIVRIHAPYSFITVRPMPLIVLNITRDTIINMYNKRDYTPEPLSPESKAELEKLQIIEPEKTAPAPKQELFDRIIIIALESVDYAYLSANNPMMPENITPVLDRLSAEYPSMNNYFCAAQPTSWGLTALLLSRLDYEKDRHILPDSIFSRAKEQGFHSYYFSAAPGWLEKNNQTYQAMFQPDVIFFREEFFAQYNCKLENQWGLSDHTLYSCVLQELKKSPWDRFIAVISTIDTHYPYHNTLSPEDDIPEDYDTPFLRSLHSADRELGIFLKNIMADETLYNDRTLIIVTADHTATHGENYTERSDFLPERVPLIIITPQKEIFSKLNTEKYASSIDLAPTLLNLIGGDIPPTFMGRDLFSEKNHAITRLTNNPLYIYSPEGLIYLDPAVDSTDDTKQIWVDYYRSFYGK